MGDMTLAYVRLAVSAALVIVVAWIYYWTIGRN